MIRLPYAFWVTENHITNVARVSAISLHLSQKQCSSAMLWLSAAALLFGNALEPELLASGASLTERRRG